MRVVKPVSGTQKMFGQERREKAEKVNLLIVYSALTYSQDALNSSIQKCLTIHLWSYVWLGPIK